MTTKNDRVVHFGVIDWAEEIRDAQVRRFPLTREAEASELGRSRRVGEDDEIRTL